MSRLEEILARTRDRLPPDTRSARSALERAAEAASPVRPFLAGEGFAVIAEFKRASPSRGAIGLKARVEEQVSAYARGGAAALSVLTEPFYFHGSPDDLRRARDATALPVLRKDFILSPLQVWESRGMGADALLLIVAALGQRDLEQLLALTRELGMAALVECHTRDEIRRAEDAGARILGINNRDLHTFVTRLEVFEELAEGVSPGMLAVAESGITGPADAERMQRAGARAVLVGEGLMRQEEPCRAVARLLGREETACG